MTLHGHGFGHGHGMSQYGAQGAAKQGLTYRQIIDFYYPGTTWSHGRRGTVRVLITRRHHLRRRGARRARAAAARHRRPARRTGCPTTAARPAGGSTVGAGNRTRRRLPDRRVAPLAAGRAGRPSSGDGAVRRADGPLTLCDAVRQPDLPRRAPRSASPVPGGPARDTVNVLRMDDYVRGVIPTEMPASWQPEAVQGPGGRGAHLRHLVARAQYPDALLPDLRHLLLPGVRRLGAEDPRRNAAVDATPRARS